MPPGRSIRMAVAALLAVSLLLSGCWDRREPETVAWVTALGVDLAPRGEYRFTFQIVQPRGAGGQAGQGPTGSAAENTIVYSVEAPDLAAAMAISETFVARRISLLHAKALIVGEELAREGVLPTMAAAIRFREFRRTMVMGVTRGTAREFLQKAKPRLEADPSLWFELMLLWASDLEQIPLTRVHDFIISLERPGAAAQAVLMASRDEQGGEVDELSGADGGEGDDGEERPPSPFARRAGDVPRAGEVPVEFLGSALFREGRLVGLLSAHDTKIAAMLQGTIDRAPWSVADPLDPKRRVTLMLRNQRPPQVRVTRRGQQVTAEIAVQMEGDLGAAPSLHDYTDPQKMRRLEQAVGQDIEQLATALLERTLHEWEVDLIDLGSHLRRQFLTSADWRAFRWEDRLSRTQAKVHVEFRARRFGLQVTPPTAE